MFSFRLNFLNRFLACKSHYHLLLISRTFLHTQRYIWATMNLLTTPFSRPQRAWRESQDHECMSLICSLATVSVNSVLVAMNNGHFHEKR